VSVLEDRIRSAGAQLSKAAPEMLPGWLTTGGIAAWLIIGLAGVLGLAGWLFAYSASISIPLLLALVIGMIAYPACEWMTARGVPKAGAAVLVLVMLLAIAAGVVWITIAGVISQWPAIEEQIQNAIKELTVWLDAIGINAASLKSMFDNAVKSSSGTAVASNPVTGGVLSSVGSAVSAGLSSVFSLAFSLFIGAALLYYVLTDFPTVSSWIATHMGGLPKDVGEGILEDAVKAMRGYFRGTTITGFVVGAVIGIAMLIMGVPLAVTVALVTFLTCYIPFFGAIVSGAFAFLVALGSNGMTTALILLVIVLVVQNVLQTVISARVMGDSLNLHPLVVLVVTMLGAVFGGLLGAALAAPLAALLINAGKRLNQAFGPSNETSTPAKEAV